MPNPSRKAGHLQTHMDLVSASCEAYSVVPAITAAIIAAAPASAWPTRPTLPART